MSRPLIASLIIIVAAGCASVIPRPSAADVPRARAIEADADLPRLDRGREVFVRRCSGCHALPEPASREGADWPAELDDMGVRAKLSPDERRVVELYVRTFDSHAPRPQ